jgi:hypothetical protein
MTWRTSGRKGKGNDPGMGALHLLHGCLGGCLVCWFGGSHITTEKGKGKEMTKGKWKEYAPEILDDNDKPIVDENYRYIEAGEGYLERDPGEKGYGEGFKISGFISPADARLIAAAPDILAALKYAVRFLSPNDHDTESMVELIAKAEGK